MYDENQRGFDILITKIARKTLPNSFITNMMLIILSEHDHIEQNMSPEMVLQLLNAFSDKFFILIKI